MSVCCFSSSDSKLYRDYFCSRVAVEHGCKDRQEVLLLNLHGLGQLRDGHLVVLHLLDDVKVHAGLELGHLHALLEVNDLGHLGSNGAFVQSGLRKGGGVLEAVLIILHKLGLEPFPALVVEFIEALLDAFHVKILLRVNESHLLKHTGEVAHLIAPLLLDAVEPGYELVGEHVLVLIDIFLCMVVTLLKFPKKRIKINILP